MLCENYCYLILIFLIVYIVYKYLILVILVFTVLLRLSCSLLCIGPTKQNQNQPSYSERFLPRNRIYFFCGADNTAPSDNHGQTRDMMDTGRYSTNPKFLERYSEDIMCAPSDLGNKMSGLTLGLETLETRLEYIEVRFNSMKDLVDWGLSSQEYEFRILLLVSDDVSSAVNRLIIVVDDFWSARFS